jgi:hypothetical protein
MSELKLSRAQFSEPDMRNVPALLGVPRDSISLMCRSFTQVKIYYPRIAVTELGDRRVNCHTARATICSITPLTILKEELFTMND